MILSGGTGSGKVAETGRSTEWKRLIGECMKGRGPDFKYALPEGSPAIEQPWAQQAPRHQSPKKCMGFNTCNLFYANSVLYFTTFASRIISLMPTLLPSLVYRSGQPIVFLLLYPIRFQGRPDITALLGRIHTQSGYTFTFQNVENSDISLELLQKPVSNLHSH